MYSKVIIIGRLGRDPEIKNLTGGTIIGNMTVAINKKTKDRETTSWINVIAFGKTAELCSRFLTKGSLAMFEGELQTRDWTAKDGTKRVSTEVLASQVKFLSWSEKDNATTADMSGVSDDDQV